MLRSEFEFEERGTEAIAHLQRSDVCIHCVGKVLSSVYRIFACSIVVYFAALSHIMDHYTTRYNTFDVVYLDPFDSQEYCLYFY